MDKKTKRLQWLGFAALNGALLGAVLLFPLYRRLADTAVGQAFLFCPVHRCFNVYCPGCGVTRALDSLLHLRPLRALTENPAAVLAAVLFALWDVRVFLSLLRGQERAWRFRLPRLYLVLAVLIGWGILRDVLLVVFGIDTLGDFPGYQGLF